MEFKIGKKINELRTEKGMSIAELSRKSGVSTGLISQIERDKVLPSVTSIWKIAQAFDTKINYFFENEQDEHIIIRKDDHRKIVTEKGNTTYQMFSPSTDDRQLDFVKIILKGSHEYSEDTISHMGEECGYVLSGTLTVLLNEEKYVLKEGDSIYFDSKLQHKYLNEDEEDCISFWAMTPKFF